MVERFDVGSQVALAALLDTDCFEQVVAGAGLFEAGEYSGVGAAELLAAHPTVRRLVMAAVTAPEARLRATVAARPDLDTVLYPVLASDGECSVRERVASNHAVPTAVLDHLTHDPEPTVRAAAVRELRRRSFPTAHAS